MEKFAEAGGTFLDTANIYADGNAERILGDFLRPDRDRFVVGTKYTLQTRPGDLNSAGSHRKNLMRSVEASLRSMGTEYVDLLWVHTRETWTPVAEVMRALDDLVRSGKVLYIGVSDRPAWEVTEANTTAELRGWTPFVALQSRYNMLERTPESDLVPMADAFDLAVVAWGPLAEGRLTGKCASTATSFASWTRPANPRWAFRTTCCGAKHHHRHVRRPMAPRRRPEDEIPPQHPHLSKAAPPSATAAQIVPGRSAFSRAATLPVAATCTVSG